MVGAGTGGTETGIARKLKKPNPDVQIIAVDPEGSILTKTAAGENNVETKFYEVEGVGYNFIPTTLDINITDKWLVTYDSEPFDLIQRICK